MRWTEWRFLAHEKEWSDGDFDWKGPAVYELAVGGPRAGDINIVYVGETGGEGVRIAAYGSGRSHIEHFIDEALRNGWTMWYRASSRETKELAKATQDNLLRQYYYPWNTIGQR